MDLQIAEAQKWALELLSSMNSDNGYNYPYTRKQFDVLADNVQDLQARGVVFSEDLAFNIAACNQDELDPIFNDLGDLLNDIFNGQDENGVDYPESVARDAERNPVTHFNCTPYPIGAPRPW